MSELDQATETVVTVVCMRLASASIVNYVVTCSWCGEACGLSEETRKAVLSHGQKVRVICRSCYELQLGKPVDICHVWQHMMQLTPGQLREMIEHLQRKERAHGAGAQ